MISNEYWDTGNINIKLTDVYNTVHIVSEIHIFITFVLIFNNLNLFNVNYLQNGYHMFKFLFI